MKKFDIVFLGIILWPVTGFSVDDFLTCPVEPSELNIEKEACQTLVAKDAESKDPKKLLTNKFNLVFDQQLLPNMENLRLDNRSNPNYLAQKTVYELRVHKECLRMVCREIFEKCNEYRSSNASLLDDQRRGCRDMADDYFDIVKNRMSIEVVENHYRKDRSLLKQKMTAISVRFQNYLAPLVSDTVRRFARFSGKVDAHIQSPKE